MPAEQLAEQIGGGVTGLALSGSAGSVKRGTGGESIGCEGVAQPASAALSSSQGSSSARGVRGRGGALGVGLGMDGLQFVLRRVVRLDLARQGLRGALRGGGALVGPGGALDGKASLGAAAAVAGAGQEQRAGQQRQREQAPVGEQPGDHARIHFPPRTKP